jgi:hypothetical protein
MIVIKFWMTCLSLLMPGALLAAGDVSNPGEQNIRLVMTKDTGAELQLEVRQAPLAQVLDSIASKAGVRINYSVLPDGLVTATCVGSTVKQVMECLLVRKADLVFRYSGQPTKADHQGQQNSELVRRTPLSVHRQELSNKYCLWRRTQKPNRNPIKPMHW